MCSYSIVVPVYQAEAYLEECIESVLRQEEHDWELILIDDGSADQSPKICDRYAKEYPNIRVLHKKNAGPIPARCSGYEMARGKYIMNLDADDCLSEYALRTIGENLRRDTDILIFGYRRIDSSGATMSQCSHLPDQTYTHAQKTSLFELLLEERAFNLVWNKVFRADLIRDRLRIPESLKNITAGEDLVLVSPLMAQAASIQTIGAVLYEYRIVSDSISRSFHQKKGTDLILSRSYMREQLQDAGLWNEEIKTCFYRAAWRTISYMVWQCARSRGAFQEKKDFFSCIIRHELYQSSLPYARAVAFPNRKKVSLWLFRHGRFRMFVWYESMQEWLKRQLKK